MVHSASDKIVGIECLRFFSSLSILFWHHQHFGFGAAGIDIIRSEQPFYPLLKPFYQFGDLGVQIFWVISGFIFFYKYFDRIAQGAVSFRTFAVYRFSRLYPLHLATLLFVALAQWVYSANHGVAFVYCGNTATQFVQHMVFVQNWVSPSLSFNGPSWAVSVEVLVYIVFFVTALWLRVGWIYLIMALAVLVLSGAGNWNLAQCILYFYVGGLVALCRSHSRTCRGGPARYLFNVLGPVAMSGALVIFVMTGLEYDAAYRSELFRVLGITGIVWLFLMLNPLFLSTQRTWVFLGNMTYASYMIHFPVQLILVLLLPVLDLTVDYRDPGLLVAYVGVTLLLSPLVYQSFEKPAQQMLRDMGRRARAEASGTFDKTL